VEVQVLSRAPLIDLQIGRRLARQRLYFISVIWFKSSLAGIGIMMDMQKSLYQNETFAEFWNERAGDSGEAYKRFVLDPLMLGLVGSLKKKAIVELGCGNGYLAPRLLEQDPRRIIMMDISKYNLAHAAKKTTDERINFLEQDATEYWKIDSSSIDIVYSNMMLNEIEDIQTAIKEVFRVLKEGGVFVFSVTHPAWDLFIYAQEKVGVSSNKVKGLGGYFRRGFAKFVMGSGDKATPGNGKEFEVEHYQRPISDYFKALSGVGFSVDQLLEPELTKELLEQAPRFSAYADNPVGLVFYCTKHG
jgi:SAM-dependent methyltransferase